MARELKAGSNVKVIADNDSGLLVGKTGTVKRIDGDYIWVQIPGHPIALPFGRDELKAANKKKAK